MPEDVKRIDKKRATLPRCYANLPAKNSRRLGFELRLALLQACPRALRFFQPMPENERRQAWRTRGQWLSVAHWTGGCGCRGDAWKLNGVSLAS